MGKQHVFALAVTLGLTSALGATPVDTRYRCVQLAGPADRDTVAVGASPNGQNIAGFSVGLDSSVRAGAWQRKKWTELTGLTRATGVNDWGHAVGYAEGSGSMLWRDGASTVLPPLPGGGAGGASDINNKGHVIGSSGHASGGWHAVLWIDGAVTDLGTLVGDAGSSTARGINRHGDIVGSSDAAPGVEAVLWKRRSHRIIRLPHLLAGVSTSAHAINDDGLIVGSGNYPGGPGYMRHALAWTTHDIVKDLGTLPFGTSSYANDVNNAGVIVGSSNVDDSVEDTLATVWRSADAAAIDLNTLIAGPRCADAAGRRFVLTNAVDVADNGTIVANGTAEQWAPVDELTFRLIPVEPLDK